MHQGESWLRCHFWQPSHKITAMEIQRLTHHQGPALMQYKCIVRHFLLVVLVFFCYKFLLSVISTLRLEAQNHGKCIFSYTAHCIDVFTLLLHECMWSSLYRCQDISDLRHFGTTVMVLKCLTGTSAEMSGHFGTIKYCSKSSNNHSLNSSQSTRLWRKTASWCRLHSRQDKTRQWV